jgi:hypothetical protein
VGGLIATVSVLLSAGGCGDGGSGPTPETADLTVGAAYIVQNTQNRDGTVPLVAGKPGVLRVFAVANQTNTAAPPVTVQIYWGATLQETLTTTRPGATVPTAVDQASLANSWNFDLPGTLIQPGLRFLVTVDPQNTVDEANDNNNTFPASGTPQPVTVSVLPPLRLRFVPVHQTGNGRTGNITAANRDLFLEILRKIMPVSDIDADIRAPFSVSDLAAEPQQGNTWVVAVSELDAARVAEGSGRYYYGVVKIDAARGGILGIAAGIPSRTSLGADHAPDEDETLAHELGHNWSLRHAPCGGAGGADPQYPYPLGLIGTYGLDLESRQVKTPQEFTDIMGYCDAAFWISDYSYPRAFNHRVENDQQTVSSAQPALLVWGRIADGELILEPAFEVVTRPVLPNAGGPYTVEGIDDAGARLFSLSFAGDQLPDVAGDQRHFAFAVPLDASASDRLATVTLRGRGREIARSARGRDPAAQVPAVAAPRAPAARRAGASVSVEWDATVHPAVMVRDARTGAILSIARGGRTSIANSASDLELLLSDGVRTTRTRIRP